MQFLKRVDPADVSSEWAVVTLLGPDGEKVLTAAGLPVPDAVGRARAIDGGGFVRRMGWPTSFAVDLVVLRSRLAGVIDALSAAGAARVGLWAFEAMRVEALRPRLGAETDHRTIPHEVGWIGSAVHLHKGCYRGQETVARVENLGRPPRRIVLLHLDGESDVLPEPGTPIESDGRAVGFLGTAVHHADLGPIALAVIKRTLADGTDLDVATQRARVDHGA
jgi:folate-binding protein YgfZ